MIVGILGNTGSGKTLLLVGTLCWELEHGRTCFATLNITYKTADGKQIHRVDFSKLLGLLGGRGQRFPMNSAVLAMDEAYLGVDSRESGSEANKYLSKLLFQSRKLGLDIYYTAQLFSSIDKRLRNISDKIVLADVEKVADKRNPKIMIPNFHYYSLELHGNHEISEFVIDYTTAQEIWKHYDTMEIVAEPTVQLGKEKSRDIITDMVKSFEGSDEDELIDELGRRER